MAEANIVTLITGPNRGIGRGILATILTRPNNTVIAAVRDPQAAASQSLNELPKADGSSLHVVKIDQGVPTDAAAAVKDLEAAGISHVDTIVANAATADVAEYVISTSTDDLRRHLDVNVIGILALFQAFEPLLRKAQGKNPKFIALSSNLGSIGLAPYIPGPWFCYGVTKAALNYLIRRIHVENDWLTATALQPGWVQTDMGNFAAKSVGLESAPMKLEDSVAGCLKVINAASREKYAGEFVSSELETVQW
ncbi:putative aflatoxin biosynthesis ketoreductase nor-1 [Aaosphaeria arxii CBS 175.79]|uniref:Putative aflatoxin biosynthesis ketoreductase nor-1 n=1 Tax=Aaosphaeria arxii CBS 175.79 TaxID=1450172 RepID=A0A6A5X7L9_9PLEO|nr:putative aflatoxin biosynthesis ketoreductase nor-1 [Aaosphaeria arxii CBS 175.79]KAF2008889.1 putative aflatoxin biosynthesis ketoreductase nor-1 [Aaosphaeria arxii CBS 175.79]